MSPPAVSETLTAIQDRLEKIEREQDAARRRSERSQKSTKFWDIIGKVGVSVSLLLAGVIAKHENDISVLKETRFTAVDALRMEARLKELQIPVWLQEDLKELKARMERIHTDVDELKRR